MPAEQRSRYPCYTKMIMAAISSRPDLKTQYPHQSSEVNPSGSRCASEPRKYQRQGFGWRPQWFRKRECDK